MREQEARTLNNIINRIQNNPVNKDIAGRSYIKGAEIFEYPLQITMADYRRLCKLIKVPDTLSMTYEELRTYEQQALFYGMKYKGDK